MTDPGLLLALAMEFALISLMTIGGGVAAIPEMHRVVVDVHHWMTSETFANLYALAQAAPGPNLIIVTLIGWETAGLAGAAVATLAICSPAFAVTYCASRVWSRWNQFGWYKVFERGIGPITMGLILASGWLLTVSAGAGVGSYFVTGATAAAALFTRLNPLVFLAVAGVIGVAGGL